MSIVVVDASTGASAVIVEQVQGPPGTLASPSGTGVVLALSGAIVGAASLGSAYQTLQTNSAGTNVTWGAVNLAQAAAVTGLLPITNIAPGTNGQALITAGGVCTWGTIVASGITPGTAGQILNTNAGATASEWVTVSGDATIASSGAVTVSAVHGATVPAGGALTTGNVLQVSGASALSYGPVNLAGGAGYVTGVLPAGNLPNLAGDVTGAITAAVVTQAQSGAITFASGTGLIGFAAADTGPGLSQASTSGATGSTMAFSAQASTNANGTPGGFTFTRAAPTGAGAESGFAIKRAASTDLLFQSFEGGNNYVATYLGAANAGTPAGGNYTLLVAQAGGYTSVNDTTQVLLSIGNATIGTVSATGLTIGAAYQFSAVGNAQFAGPTSLGGGVGVLGLSNATTQPSSAPSGGIVLAANAGNLNIYDSAGYNLVAGGKGLIFGPAAANSSITIGITTGTTTGTAASMAVAAQITSGAGGTGGAASLTGGDATGTTGTCVGGAVLITSGAATATSGSGTGGAITLNAAGGTVASGAINCEIAGVIVMQISGSQVSFVKPLSGATSTPLALIKSTIPLTSGGTVTASSAQQGTPYLALTGTLSGAGTILQLNGVVGLFLIDTSGVTFASNTLTIKNGAGALPAYTTLTGNLSLVYCPTTSTIVGANV